MLGGFRASKCKTSCKLCVSRIKLLRNKRDIQITQQRREIGKLLSEGKNEYAWIRVEGVMRESNLMAAYEILELYLELVAVRTELLEKQKTCPKDMVEAISTLMYAASRVADLPELAEVRKIFANKFGKELGVEGAKNLNGEEPPNWQVNLRLRQYLSVETPDPEDKLTVISSIAEEANVKFKMEEYAQSVMVDLHPIVEQPPPQRPHEAMFAPPANYPSARQQGNLAPTVIMQPSFGNQEPGGDRPVLPPSNPSFRAPFQGPSTGGYTDAQMRIMGQTVQDEETEFDDAPPMPQKSYPDQLQQSNSELEQKYNAAPGPPSKPQDVDDNMPSAPPVETQNNVSASSDLDDDLNQRLADLRKR